MGRPDEEVLEIDEGEVLVIVQGHHGEEENLQVLTRLVDHFERQLDDPATLGPEYAAPIAKGTVGLRIPIDRFELKRKLSQNKDEETRRNVIAALREDGPYRHPVLAEEMERELDGSGEEEPVRGGSANGKRLSHNRPTGAGHAGSRGRT